MTSLGSFGTGLSLAAATIALRVRGTNTNSNENLANDELFMGLRDLEPSTRRLGERFLFETDFKSVPVPMLHGLGD
jgi:hypothetical protein